MNQHFSIKILFFLILLISNIFFCQNNNVKYLNYVKIERKIDSLYDINHNEGIKLVKFYIKKSKKIKIMKHYFMLIVMPVKFLVVLRIFYTQIVL